MTNSLNTNAQWEAAATRARNVAVPKKHSRRWWTRAWIVLAVVSAGVLGFSLTSWIVPTGENGRLEFVPSRLAMQSTLTAVVVLVVLYGVFWGSVTERLVERSSTIMSALSRTEKRSVRRQLAGREPVDETRLPIVLAIGRQSQRLTEGSLPHFLAYGLLYVTTEIGLVDSSAPYRPFFSIALALLFVACAAYMAVTYLKTARFIQAHSTHLSAANP